MGKRTENSVFKIITNYWQIKILESYEERNVEIYFADARGDTYRDSNKPRSAELYVDPPLPSRGEGDELVRALEKLSVV